MAVECWQCLIKSALMTLTAQMDSIATTLLFALMPMSLMTSILSQLIVLLRLNAMMVIMLTEVAAFANWILDFKRLNAIHLIGLLRFKILYDNP